MEPRVSTITITPELNRIVNIISLHQNMTKLEVQEELVKNYLQTHPELRSITRTMAPMQKATTSLKSHKRVRDTSGNSRHKGPIAEQSNARGQILFTVENYATCGNCDGLGMDEGEWCQHCDATGGTPTNFIKTIAREERRKIQ